MKQYKVRIHKLGWQGFITQADHYQDMEMESPEPLKEIAKRLAQEGFEDPDSGKWIMPGAIMWIEESR
jgi:hypothetical protein